VATDYATTAAIAYPAAMLTLRTAPIVLAALAVSSLVFAVGCGPKWVVVKQASPNPMSASTKFVVEKPTLDANFRVGTKTEQEWMSTKKSETQDKWEGDKVAFVEKFVEGFMAEKDSIVVENAAGAGIFGIRTRIMHYEPGHYIGISTAPSTMDATIEFLDANGTVADEIRIHTKAGGFSAGTAGRECARQVGIVTAKYLKERTGP